MFFDFCIRIMILKKRRSLSYQFLSFFDLPVNILNERSFFACELRRHEYRLLFSTMPPDSGIPSRHDFGCDSLLKWFIDIALYIMNVRWLTAVYQSNPTYFRGDVSCQNSVLLFVVIDERRHLCFGSIKSRRNEFTASRSFRENRFRSKPRLPFPVWSDKGLSIFHAFR